eukprot:249170-Pelagomonas_calceolata.AAC.1
MRIRRFVVHAPRRSDSPPPDVCLSKHVFVGVSTMPATIDGLHLHNKLQSCISIPVWGGFELDPGSYAAWRAAAWTALIPLEEPLWGDDQTPPHPLLGPIAWIDYASMFPQNRVPWSTLPEGSYAGAVHVQFLIKAGRCIMCDLVYLVSNCSNAAVRTVKAYSYPGLLVECIASKKPYNKKVTEEIKKRNVCLCCKKGIEAKPGMVCCTGAACFQKPTRPTLASLLPSGEGGSRLFEPRCLLFLN